MFVNGEWSTLDSIQQVSPDWKITILSQFATEKRNSFVNGPFGSDLLSSELIASGVPVVYIRDIKDGRYQRKSIVFVTQEKADSLGACKTSYGDTIFSKVGDPPCEAAVYTDKRDAIITQDVIRIKTSDILYSYFLSYLINSDIGRRQVKRIKITGTRERVSLTDFKKLQLPFPPPQEQQKIAKILSTWDKAIESVEALILAKQQRKKALMQQLLTGKKRFDGFDDEFIEYKLEQLCQFKKGKGLSKDKIINDGKYKCILYGELYTKYEDVVKTVVSKTNDIESIKSISGDILIPSSTTTTAIDLANAVALMESDVFLGGDINILRPDVKKVCSEFLAYLLTHIKKYEIASKAQGITIIHLYNSNLKEICVNLPLIKEQQKIASVLSAADKEIETHQKHLAALKQQKQGLMQQLLTGKKRVKVEA